MQYAAFVKCVRLFGVMKMRYRHITMEFPEPLTEEQYEMLRINLDAVTEGLKVKLQNMLDEIEHGWAIKGMRALPAGNQTILLMKTAITHALFNLRTYVYYRRGHYVTLKDEQGVVTDFVFVRSDRHMTFCYAKDVIALAKYKQSRFLNPVDEARVCEGLKRFVFPDMKVDPSKVLLETGWVGFEKV